MNAKHPETDRGIEMAKKLLCDSAADQEGSGEWREGYDTALKTLLLNLGIDVTYVPATYTFDDIAAGEST